jgi:hypothetical protein
MNIPAAYKGFIIGVLMIATALIAYNVLKLPVNEKEQYILYAIFTIGIIWSLLSVKNDSSVNSFQEFFGIGFRTFMIATLLMVIFTIIYFKLNTSHRDFGIAENKKLLLAEGNHTPAEIDSNAEQLKNIFIPMMVGITTFKYLILGALITAVGAVFLSQQKANGRV